MAAESKKAVINWYRVPVDKETMRRLNTRSDWLGFLQTGGYLGLLALSGASVFYAWGRWPIAAVGGLIFLHGTFFAFLLNGFHELVHNTVFKTRWLNAFFLRIFSFLSWNSYKSFDHSHTRHHQFTLHPPDDREVVLPITLTLKGFLQSAFVDYHGIKWVLKGTIRTARGKFNSDWERDIFPESDPAARRELFRWARVILAGHVLVIAVTIYFQIWPLAIVTTLARFYGGWLLFLCNNTQHVGLQDNVPDFRLCCRTVYLNPFVQFLYWHMNYHTEHHMYAAVPCYRLGALHRAIKRDLPPCPRGLIAAWRGINAILQKQKADPKYQYAAPLPETAPALAAAS